MYVIWCVFCNKNAQKLSKKEEERYIMTLKDAKIMLRETIKEIKTVDSKFKIKPLHIKFLAEYFLNNFNATEAYRKVILAGKKEVKTNHCTINSYRLLNQKNVKNVYEKMLIKYLDALKFTRKISIPQFYADRMDYNINDIIDIRTGELRENLTDEQMALIDGIEVKYYGKDSEKKIITYRMPDKTKHAQLLEKHLQLVEEKAKNINVVNIDTERINEMRKKVKDAHLNNKKNVG